MNSDKRSSLLQNGINYESKKFGIAGPTDNVLKLFTVIIYIYESLQ